MNSARSAKHILKAAFWSLCVVIAILALVPQDPMQQPLFALGDKVVHALAFLILCLVGLYAYPTRLLSIALLLIALGGGIEIAQGYVASRSQELADFYADLIGIAIAFGLCAARTMAKSSLD